jgi:hypothetical protein
MAKYAECIHGRNSAFCVMGCDPIPIAEKPKPVKKESLARPRKPAQVAAAVAAPKPKVSEPETEQQVLNDICDVLGTPRRPLKPGEGVPVPVLQVAQGRLGLGYKVAPDTAERIVRKAGVAWKVDYLVLDEAGEATTVLTIDGARALRSALASLLG